jgi:1-deoxy-D-xylulose-5-phosphate synthase
MAMGGLHPVVAIYATFLNRAFDQLLMDVALHRQPVTVVLDRAGITGPDGPSHHGMWDISMLGLIPGIRVAAPRDADSLRTELREAVAVEDGPTVLRFPRGAVIESVPSIDRVGTVDVLRRPADGESADVLLVAVGAFGAIGLAAAERIADQGIGVTVVDPRWVVPVPGELLAMAGEHRLVVTLEDGGRHGGFGWALSARLRDAGLPVPLLDLAVHPAGHPGRGARRSRPDRTGRGPPDHRVGGRSARRASPHGGVRHVDGAVGPTELTTTVDASDAGH